MKALKSPRAEALLNAASENRQVELAVRRALITFPRLSKAKAFSFAERKAARLQAEQDALDAARARVQAAGGPTLGQLLAEFEAVGCKV